jgi:hypothetical protein
MIGVLVVEAATGAPSIVSNLRPKLPVYLATLGWMVEGNVCGGGRRSIIHVLYVLEAEVPD